MAKKSIQKPLIIAIHLIQEENRYNKPHQLVCFDNERAFDRVSHKIIADAFQAFGVPEITISAIWHFTLVGYAYIEIKKNKKGLVITIQTRLGQEDPLSSILFLLALETLNLTLATILNNLMHTTCSPYTSNSRSRLVISAGCFQHTCGISPTSGVCSCMTVIGIFQQEVGLFTAQLLSIQS